jgi:hypothetical protein
MKNLDKLKGMIKKFQQGGAFNYRIAANIANQYNQSKTPFKKNYFADDPFHQTYEQNPQIADKGIYASKTNPGTGNEGMVVRNEPMKQSFAFNKDFLDTVFNPAQVPVPKRPALAPLARTKPDYMSKSISMRKKGGKV